jgi:hypothetical protein
VSATAAATLLAALTTATCAVFMSAVAVSFATAAFVVRIGVPFAATAFVIVVRMTFTAATFMVGILGFVIMATATAATIFGWAETRQGRQFACAELGECRGD